MDLVGLFIMRNNNKWYRVGRKKNSKSNDDLIFYIPEPFAFFCFVLIFSLWFSLR